MDLEVLCSIVMSHQKAADASQANVNGLAAKVAPEVLAHFNDWVQTTLTPILPQRTYLKGDTTIDYTPRGFRISMGPLYDSEKHTPVIRTWFQLTSRDAFNEYKRSAPWIAAIKTPFSPEAF